MRPARSSAMISATEAISKDSGSEPGKGDNWTDMAGTQTRRESPDFTAPGAISPTGPRRPRPNRAIRLNFRPENTP